jgi:hypothetical protein
MFKSKARLTAKFLLTALPLLAGASCLAQSGPMQFADVGVSSSALPEAPVPRPGVQAPARARLGHWTLDQLDSGWNGPQTKWDVSINPGETPHPYSAKDKIKYALREEFDLSSVFTAAYSGGYEHLRDTDPHYGSDSAAFGERVGAAAFRQGVYRIFGDGLLPALTHEDPRYYRVRDGNVWHRSLGSIEQIVIRHRDDGSQGIGYAELAGHVMAEGLPLTFYPRRSSQATVAVFGFCSALGADGATKLAREFLPDLFRAVGLNPGR